MDRGMKDLVFIVKPFNNKNEYIKQWIIVFNGSAYYSAGMPFSTPHRSSRGTCIVGSILNRFSQNLAQTRPFEV